MRPVVAAVAVLSLSVLAGCERPQPRGDTPPGPPPRAIPVREKPLPALPGWSAPLIGKGLREAFPHSGVCVGNTDGPELRYVGPPAGLRIGGWGWDLQAKAAVRRVILVDIDARIVGAGDGRTVERTDVPAAQPDIDDPKTGWFALTARTDGPIDIYGVVGSGSAICPLGHLDLVAP